MGLTTIPQYRFGIMQTSNYSYIYPAFQVFTFLRMNLRIAFGS